MVESIDEWRYNPDGSGVKLLIRWQGYDESERTWEPLLQVFEDVAVIVQKYVDTTRTDRSARTSQATGRSWI